MMTRRNATSKLIGTAMVGAMLVVPLLVSASIAQPWGGRDSRGRHGGDHPRALLRELGLTEEQREEMHALADPSSGETFERATQMRNALNEAVENGEDESAIRQYAYELGMAEGDAAVSRARTHAHMMQILTDEQRGKYRALKAERKQKMEERKQRFEERRSQRRERNPDSF